MATSFDTIENQALVTVNDYKIAKLYAQGDAANFQSWLDGFLLTAVPNFLNCQQSLAYDATARTFTSDLTNIEVSILADLWIIAWWERERNNAAQIANKLQTNSSFKTNASSPNMKEKTVIIDGLRERVRQKMLNDYPLQSIDSITI